ncbi:MAG: hypothetical protein VX548_03655 [Bacteroidota bacterium]|nr:hypothetical protein [Bacteroidota bacterium]
MAEQHILANGPNPMCLGDKTGDGVIRDNNMLTIMKDFGSNTLVGQDDIENDGFGGANDMLVLVSLFGTSYWG